MLTTAQKVIVKAYVEADGTLNQIPHTADGADAIAQAFKVIAAPPFVVWKSNVTIAEVGRAIVATGLTSLTTANTSRLGVFAQLNPEGLDPARIDHRTALDDIFSVASGTSTRDALLALYKRSANILEKILATGTGSDASPATMGFEGSVGYTEIASAMGWSV